MPTQRRPQAPPEFLDRAFGFPGWLSTRELRRRQNPEPGAKRQEGNKPGVRGDRVSFPAHSSSAGASSLGKAFTPKFPFPHLQNGCNNPYAWGVGPRGESHPSAWTTTGSKSEPNFLSCLCRQGFAQGHLAGPQACSPSVGPRLGGLLTLWARTPCSPATTSLMPYHQEKWEGHLLPFSSGPRVERNLGCFQF